MNVKGLKKKNTLFAYLACTPVILYLLFALFIPMIWGFSLSFTDKTIGGDATFIGLKNYKDLLHDTLFIKSILNTLIYTLFSILGKIIFGIAMALSMNMDFKGKNAIRALLIIPWTLPNIVAVLNWKWLLSETGGVISYILKILGLVNQDVVWFGSASIAMFSIIMVNIWRGTPFFGISILSQLQSIPRDYYEAADVDGATALQKFYYITLPCISNIVLLTALVSSIWTINEFESVWLLTGGGPSGATELINIYSYRTAMTNLQLGKGVAVSVLAMPVLILLIRIITKEVFTTLEQ